MAKLVIDLPKEFIFSTNLQVRIGDCSGGVHLGNHFLISYLNEALMTMLKSGGFSDLSISGYSFINSDLSVSYLSESIHGDILNIKIAIDAYHKYGCDLLFRVENETTGVQTAAAKMGMLFFDYPNKRLGEVPQVFREAFTP